MTTRANRELARRRATLPEGEPMGIQDIRDALVIRQGDLFLLTDEHGNVPLRNERGFGLYHQDTRHLSGFDFYFHASPPVVLLSTAELGFSSEHVLTNPELRTARGEVIRRGTIEVRRQRLVSGLLEERLEVTNYGGDVLNLDLHFDLEADFADIFEVRGLKRQRFGTHLPPEVTANSIIYRYGGIDGSERTTTVIFHPAPDVISAAGVTYSLQLPHRRAWRGRIAVALNHTNNPGAATTSARVRFSTGVASYRRWLSGCTQVVTDNEFFNKVLERSLSDLRMLWDETEDGVQFPAAGTPWFDALFGRDSLIVGLQTLAYRPEIARETLKALARWQGKEIDERHDEEPGKILHELRRDELSVADELPYSPYYGTVDATPLFLLLAAEYYRWTDDLRSLRQLQPNILAAIDWLDRYGDTNGDGYVEYEKHSERGLVNQGWKDSGDSVCHADGSLAEPPISLVEVQGYVYAAKRRLGPLLEALGQPALAARLAREAQALRRRFEHEFWLPHERFYAMALDGRKRACAAITSNPGHALWTGIVSRDRAPLVVERMLANDLFSGWGVRTLSRPSPRYNPLGYHLGSVWPHDNAIAAFGFKMYGCEDEANEVATALFDAALAFPYYRLPELFGGEARTAHHAPVPYPVACRPQAWAAGAFPMLLHAILGLRPDAQNRSLLIVRPRLPYWLNTVQLRGLRIGRGYVDLLFQRRQMRTHVEVLEGAGGIEVATASRWPL